MEEKKERFKEGFDLERELKKLPERPGVYLMHGDFDEVIYVGKAIVLKNRVRQYFQSSRGKSTKIRQMVAQIRWFEYIVTDSEAEALVLECNLIKEYQPRYNTLLKDSKGYPYLRVTVSEDFPRIQYAHQMQRPQNGVRYKYFGPYPSRGDVKETLELLQKMLKLRTCNRTILANGSGAVERPCLNYQMKLCDAPCQGNISKEAYGKRISLAMSLLKGHDEVLTKELEQKMKEASENLDFEAAMEYRDLIQSVKTVASRQKLSDRDGDNKDIVALASERGDAVVQVFFVREGRMIGQEHYHLQLAPEESEEEMLSSFLRQYYAGTPFVPAQIYLPFETPEQAFLEDFLTKRRGGKVSIVIPKKGDKEKLVEMAANNAKLLLEKDREKFRKEEARTLGAMRMLREMLDFPIERPLSRVESYDISNTGGFQSVGSMVVFQDGSPKKSDYRKFRMKWVKGMNDYACMEEMLTRRFMRAKEQSDGFERLPDIILMDGGKGQMHIAEAVLEKLGLDIPVCGMVKDNHHRTRGLYFGERLVDIPSHSLLFQMITRIQDETHRFAIEYHRSLRAKAQTHSVLDDIPGIGPKRRTALMVAFENLEQLREASLEELMDVPGMNRGAAEAVIAFFHEK